MAHHQGRVAIVTGSNVGIGAAIAHRLAADGAQVMLAARTAATLETVAKSIEAAGGRATWRATDLSRPETPEELAQATLEAHGRIDMIVNCVGMPTRQAFMDVPDEDWLWGFSLKVMAAIRLFKAAWPQLVENRGAVVSIGGTGARAPNARQGMTSMLSVSLMGATKAMADVGLAHGVRVNMVNPGSIVTSRKVPQMKANAARDGITYEEALAKLRAERSTMRLGRPEDIADLVGFILSPQGELLNGAIIDMDGGSTKAL